MPKQLPYNFAIILIAFFVFGGLCQQASATDDPLGKPAIWNQLQKSPVDSVLWAQYFGKPWICMSNNELSDLQSWRDELLTMFKEEHSHDNDHVNWEDPKAHIDGKLEYVDHEIEEEKKRLDQELIVYVQELKTYMLEETSTLKELKKNIIVNFVMIEEVYEEEFQKMGASYVWYEDRHPKGKYNKQTWVQEKEEELRRLKEKEFEKRKAALIKETY